MKNNEITELATGIFSLLLYGIVGLALLLFLPVYLPLRLLGFVKEIRIQ